jgi:hypothetical protein
MRTTEQLVSTPKMPEKPNNPDRKALAACGTETGVAGRVAHDVVGFVEGAAVGAYATVKEAPYLVGAGAVAGAAIAGPAGIPAGAAVVVGSGAALGGLLGTGFADQETSKHNANVKVCKAKLSPEMTP